MYYCIVIYWPKIDLVLNIRGYTSGASFRCAQFGCFSFLSSFSVSLEKKWFGVVICLPALCLLLAEKKIVRLIFASPIFFRKHGRDHQVAEEQQIDVCV